MSEFSHLDSNGHAHMVDVGDKKATRRSATASVRVELSKSTYHRIERDELAKGNVLTVAKLAGIQAAKETSRLIPLCHQLPLDGVEILFSFDKNSHHLLITATAKTTADTGVEMEALTACSIAALTVYDMVKAVQKDVVINDLKLLCKSGGKSGDFTRSDS